MNDHISKLSLDSPGLLSYLLLYVIILAKPLYPTKGPSLGNQLYPHIRHH